VVSSALRTLSVVTLLSAVSGTVLLLNGHHGGVGANGGESVNSAESALTRGSAVPAVPAGFTSPLIPAPRVEASSYRMALRIEAEAKIDGLNQARDTRLAEAFAARKRQGARVQASRSARRDPKAVARVMAGDRGWGSGQYSCLVSLWNRESRWNRHASNPSSGAYGIPQALPGRKMASAGSDWRNNPVTQIRWGLNYIADRYRTPCGAWGHSQSSGWY
jgi:hypothetical protein